MKRETVEDKFNGYQKIIKSNIATIKELIDQSKKLNELLDITSDDESQKRIKNIQYELQDSINDLLDNTDKLFKEYKYLINEYII